MATPEILVYATGGVGLLNVEASVDCPGDNVICNPSDGFQSWSEEETLFGWTLGAGVEAWVSENWTIRGEYRYADYGSLDATLPAAQPNSSFGAAHEIDFRTHIAFIGAAYRF